MSAYVSMYMYVSIFTYAMHIYVYVNMYMYVSILTLHVYIHCGDACICSECMSASMYMYVTNFT